ncbi:MAG: sensor histidine kinase KdpD [Candidatus Limnocylindria bacterium]
MAQGDATRQRDRPTADEMLELVRREAGAGARGRHRLYLGMAPGVGKTYAALEELRRRRDRGTDAIIGYVETYGRPRTIEAVGDLEIIPRRPIEYRGVTLEEMDIDAVIARHPDIVLVDEIAHTNAPGSRHVKRWQDVDELLGHGITVISTMNVQHLDSVADIVERITGVDVRERVPDEVLDGASEVQLVDMTPHALRQRIRHGNVYPPERAELALDGFFREGNLTALRELVLRRVANVVEDELEDYMRAEQVEESWPACEGVAVVIDTSSGFGTTLRRAWRSAKALGAPLVAIWAEPARWGGASPEEWAQLESNIRLAEDLGAEVVRRTDARQEDAVLEIVRGRNLESVFVARHPVPWWRRAMGDRALAERLVDEGGVDVHVVADDVAGSAAG